MFANASKAKTIFGAAGVLAVTGLGIAVWNTFPILKRHDSMLAQNAGVKQSVNTLGGRLEQQKVKLDESSNSIDQLRQQIAELRKEMKSRFATVNKQAKQSTEDLFHYVQVEVGGQIEGIKAKVARLELSRDADQTEIAALQNELSEVRKELAAQTQELKDKLAEDGAGTEKKLATLEASQEKGRQQFDELNRKLSIKRIDFEVNKGHSYELAPGISLEVTGTDIAYRRVTGWMWVLPDRRTIWLRGQGAQEPVVFYSNDDGKKRELVITSVTKKSAVGYLLVPEETATAEAAVAGTDANASE